MVHCSCAILHQSLRLMGGVRQPWEWVSPRVALWLAMRLGLFLGLGRMHFSHESGTTEAVWCKVGCARWAVHGLRCQPKKPGYRCEMNFQGDVRKRASFVSSFCLPISKVGTTVLFYHVSVKSRGWRKSFLFKQGNSTPVIQEAVHVP